MIIIRHLFFITLSLLAASANAQVLTPEYRVFSVKDGLSSVETYDVMQDSKGYIWVASDAGVSRFDGYSFRNFTSMDGLSDNTVFGINEDHKGRIWFRTLSGRISYFENDSIYSLQCNSEIQKHMGTGTVLSLYVDRGDTLWLGIGAAHHPFLKVLPGFKKAVTVSTPIDLCYFLSQIDEKIVSGYPYGATRIKFDIHRLNILSRTKNISSSRLDTERIKRLNVEMRAIRLSSGEIAFIFGDAICKVDATGKLQTQFTGKNLNSIYEDRDKNLWVGAANEGVDVFRNGDILSHPVNYFSGKYITNICQDREGSYWLTTHEEGLLFVPDLNFFNWKFGNGAQVKVSSLAVDSAHIWISFNDSSLIALDKKTHTVKSLQGAGIILSIVPLPKGEVLAGTNSASVLFSGNSRRVIPRMATRNMVKGPGKSTLWGSVYNNLRKYENYTVTDSIRMQVRIDAIHCDSEGVVWIGTLNGLWKLPENSRVPEYMGEKSKLLQNRMMSITTHGSDLWLASKGAGVIIIRPDTILNITTAQGLGSNICRSVCFDITGAAWVGSNKGLSRIKLNADDTWEVTNINSSNGLVSDDVRQVISDENYLYAGTGNGITFFDVTRLKKNSTPPPVYLTALEVNGERREPGSITTLEHNENYLNFYFTGLSYKLPGKVKYICQLEGIDKEPRITWSTSAQYTTLPPGSYTFKVYAQNNDGVISKEPLSISFTILKPFWATWWFLLLSILLGVFIIATIILLRERSIRRREAEKTELSKRMGDLELRAIRAQMNPHFIFNALNSIQRYVLDNDPLEAQRYLAKFARLIRNVLSNSAHQSVPLAKELETLRLYVEIESLRFGDHFRYSFEVAEEIDTESLLVPSMFIQPYIENAIWHGLMHKENDRELQIKVSISDEHLVFIIGDNGVGRSRSQEMKRSSGREHESFGMKLNQERIVVLNQMHETETRLIITDLYDKDEKAAGTRVEIQFPLVYIH